MKKLSIYSVFIVVLVLGISCKENKKEETTKDTTEEIVTETNFGGLALYTLRDDMGVDPKAVLQEVANDGYAYIEAAGYNEGKLYNMSREDFANLLKELELTRVSTQHCDVSLENGDAMMKDVKTAGFEYFVVPIPPMGLFHFDDSTMTMSMSGGAENLSKIVNTLGEKAHAAGLKLLYHNHDFEFKKDADGIVPIEYLLEHSDPKYVNFQMDLFWVTKAGADPIAYFKKYPGRFKIWHVKDMDKEGRFAPVGNGTIDFATILANKELSGMQYYMVEQDMTFDGMKPLEAIKISHDGLKNIGFK